MTIFRISKFRLISTLATLLMTLQMTACSTEDMLTAVVPGLGSDTNPVTYTDTNHAAIITGTNNGSVTKDSNLDNNKLLKVSGKLNITDSNDGEASFVAETITGNYGKLVIDLSGNWHYVADNNQSFIQNLNSDNNLIDGLTVSSVDGTTHLITITIIGTPAPAPAPNSPATISGIDHSSVTEDTDLNGNQLETGGRLVITDLDAGENTFIPKEVTGSHGRLSITSSGNWRYTADNDQTQIQNLLGGETLTDNLTINSADGTAHTITITILGSDENNATASISLSWNAPVQREDNSALSLQEIKKYTIHYGTTPGQYTDEVVTYSDSITLTHLPVGTYYFVITTTDTDGRVSQRSTEVTVTI